MVSPTLLADLFRNLPLWRLGRVHDGFDVERRAVRRARRLGFGLVVGRDGSDGRRVHCSIRAPGVTLAMLLVAMGSTIGRLMFFPLAVAIPVVVRATAFAAVRLPRLLPRAGA